MAKFELKFLDETNFTFIKVKKEESEDLIKINIGSDIMVNGVSVYNAFIKIDKSTAIKFAKTLRTEINKIKEVQNG